MLATAQRQYMDPTMGLILGMIGGGREARGELKPGLVEISHFSADQAFKVKDNEWDEHEKFGCDFYGVADSPEQAFAHAEKHLGAREEKFCVFVTHIAKDPSNAGRGGGWRWHKWGPYIGTSNPTTEYLDDEAEFNDGVYVFHIYQLR